MKKKVLGILLVVTLMFVLTGCSMKYPELEKNAIGFQTSSYIDENDDNAEYLIIEYNGRIYMPYGTLKGTLKEKDIKKCIGYIIQNDSDDKDTRIYTLTNDEDNNFLMEHYIKTNLMNQPFFYRAIDTKDKNVDIPKFIDDLKYNYWK